MKARKRYTPPPMTTPGRHLGQSSSGSNTGGSTAGSAANDRLAAAQAPTMPPPAMRARGQAIRPEPLRSGSASGSAPAQDEPMERNRSGVRARKSQQPPAAATVDEVTADMSNDPRREED